MAMYCSMEAFDGNVLPVGVVTGLLPWVFGGNVDDGSAHGSCLLLYDSDCVAVFLPRHDHDRLRNDDRGFLPSDPLDGLSENSRMLEGDWGDNDDVLLIEHVCAVDPASETRLNDLKPWHPVGKFKKRQSREEVECDEVAIGHVEALHGGP